jgi:3-methyladenine DNA glycosylase/8-oxoguanine DNA glycosylase
MNANELADKLMSSLTMEYDCDEYMEQAATMLRQQQAEIEALKRQVKAQDNSIAAADMMIAQFEDKFGEYEKVINGNYVKVRPHEFIAAATGKEHIVGTPMMYAEWPMRDDE